MPRTIKFPFGPGQLPEMQALFTIPSSGLEAQKKLPQSLCRMLVIKIFCLSKWPELLKCVCACMHAHTCLFYFSIIYWNVKFSFLFFRQGCVWSVLQERSCQAITGRQKCLCGCWKVNVIKTETRLVVVSCWGVLLLLGKKLTTVVNFL